MISYLGIGSNIEPEKNILACMKALQNTFQQVRFSKTYESQAVGFDGDNFYNLVAEIDDDRELDKLISLIKVTENNLGRLRGGERFSSRHIDIDILLYGSLVCQQPIVLPRPEIYNNAYVLCPLAELAPSLISPNQGVTYKKLWDDFDKARQPLVVVD